MATLIKTDGSKLEIQPQNGLGFQLDELQKFVDGYIDIINLHNGDILVINDNGKDVLDSNETATEIAHKHNAIFGWDYICGDVVMCKDEEVQKWKFINSLITGSWQKPISLKTKAKCFLVLRVVAVQLWATSWQGLM